MTKDELSKALNYVNASRVDRTKMAKKIEAQPHLIPLLIEISTENNDPVSCKASWVLESIANQDLSYIYHYLDPFINSLSKLKLESSIRPASKICQLLIQHHFSKKLTSSNQILQKNHLNTISESAFDWLIGDHKVAPKAYSMTTLLLLGRKIEWIHSELQLILKQNYESGSAAYKARARKTLKILEKK
ncbi:adenylosuccinate lyase [Maribacter hydrothermalis]|uniref:Adenylosuccinate lyase n=1 Tax=Maribacter hydrothermalis TaxID=1836467 RepID=A0A1B7Z7R3_9FLAO|nr:adenylosuccinate lyase [Maribacter hydrothermalis]APQ15864.1 adenylosuccinate lyase [Maribacter hydrothermalis]OBR38757.1 adenylosuccinate lyase [Maribacter hydrothermalis]